MRQSRLELHLLSRFIGPSGEPATEIRARLVTGMRIGNSRLAWTSRFGLHPRIEILRITMRSDVADRLAALFKRYVIPKFDGQDTAMPYTALTTLDYLHGREDYPYDWGAPAEYETVPADPEHLTAGAPYLLIGPKGDAISGMTGYPDNPRYGFTILEQDPGAPRPSESFAGGLVVAHASSFMRYIGATGIELMYPG